MKKVEVRKHCFRGGSRSFKTSTGIWFLASRADGSESVELRVSYGGMSTLFVLHPEDGELEALIAILTAMQPGAGAADEPQKGVT